MFFSVVLQIGVNLNAQSTSLLVRVVAAYLWAGPVIRRTTVRMELMRHTVVSLLVLSTLETKYLFFSFTQKSMTYGLGKFSFWLRLQINFVHPPSLNVETTAAFPATGCVMALMTVEMVLMKTRNAVSNILLTITSWKYLVPHPVAEFQMFNLLLMLSQNPRPAVRRLSSVLAPTCVCRSAGSVMEIRTALMGLMRASKLAAVSWIL